jgi:integrase
MLTLKWFDLRKIQTMATIRLTRDSLKNLRPPPQGKNQALYWCQDLAGFGVRVSPKSKKTFIVQRDVGGKTRRISIGDASVLTITDARKHAQRILGDLMRGVDPNADLIQKASEGITLNEALQFYTTKHRRIADSTRSHVQAVLEKHLSDWLRRPLRGISRDEISDRHEIIAKVIYEKWRKRGVDGYSGESTANLTMRYLRTVWNFALERESNLPECPVTRLSRTSSWYEDKTRNTDILENGDLPKFWTSLQQISNEIQKDYLALILFTGLRRREAGALRWDELNLDEMTLHIPGERRKNKKALEIPISEFVVEILKRRLASKENAFVFPGNTKDGYIAEGGRFALRQIAKMTGIQVSHHGLRRTWITNLEASGISYLAVKSLAGHTTGVDVTSRNYITLTNERLAEPLEKATECLLEKIDEI